MTDQILSLWKSGSVLALGIVAVYLGLQLVAKVDKKRAFFYSGAIAALGGVADAALAGHQLQWGALFSALATIAALVVQGPDLKKKPVE